MSTSYFERLGTTGSGSRALASARLRLRALSILHEALAKQGVSQAELGRRLGIRKSAVNQTLNSDGAMKLNTLAEYLDALGYEAEITLHPRGTLRLRAQMEAPQDNEDWQLLTGDSPEDSLHIDTSQGAATVSPALTVDVEGWEKRSSADGGDR